MMRTILLVLLMTASAHAEGSYGGGDHIAGDEVHVGGRPPPREIPEAERKAKAEMEARDKRWDASMRKVMSGVCRGC